MDRYTKKYKEIVDRLIDKSFPKLKTRIIFTGRGRIFNYEYFAITFYFIFFSWIFVHPKLDKASKNQVKGVLAHELSHLDIIANLNFFKKIKFGWGWLFTKKGKINFERDADIYAIKKGYGKGLLERVIQTEKKCSEEENIKRRLKGYLDSREIKSYIKKFKK